MMRGALIGVTVSAVLVLSLMLLLWMNDRRQEMGILVSLGVGKPSLVAQYLAEMVLIGSAVPCPRLAVRAGNGPMARHHGAPFRERLRGEGAEQHGAGRRRS